MGRGVSLVALYREPQTRAKTARAAHDVMLQTKVPCELTFPFRFPFPADVRELFTPVSVWKKKKKKAAAGG